MFPHRPFHLKTQHGVSFSRVRAGDQEDIGFHNVPNGVGHRSRANGRGQTGHAAAVSETGAVVDIIGANDRPGQFLEQVVFFVGAFGGGKEGDTVGAVVAANLVQSGSDGFEGGVPGCRFEGLVAAVSQERLA